MALILTVLMKNITMNKLIKLTVVLSLLVVTIGCNSSNKKNIKASTNKLHWAYIGKLVKGEFIKPVKNSYLDLHFNSEGNFGGSGGCNTYSGKFTEHKNSMKIVIGEIGSTMAMCVDNVMKQEDVYLSSLKKVIKKEFKGNKLHLYFSENDYLVFIDISDQFKPM